jgi:hypothetical protein
MGQTAYLAELVMWPLLTAGIPAGEIRLVASPSENVAGWQEVGGAAGEIVEFGLLAVGTAADPGITFALIHSDPPQLLVDTDNDEDFSNNVPIAHREQISSRSYNWSFIVSGEYEAEPGVTLAEIAVTVTALYSYDTGGYTVGYSSFSHRKGHVEIGGELIPIAICSARTDGTYEADQLYIAVDSDRDGHANSLPGSHEVFLPGQDFQIGTMGYRIVHVTPWGDRMVLEPIGVAPGRPVIAVGQAAPVFEVTTIDDEVLSLQDLTGRVVILMLLPGLGDGGCFSCAASSPFLDELRSVHEIVGDLDGVSIVVAVTSGAFPGDRASLPSAGVYYTTDPSIAALYRRNIATLIISPDGAIVAQDEVWVNYDCERPRGMFDELMLDELVAVVERLVSEMEDL